MDYLDETLAADVRETFERHLTACPNCVRYLESYKTTTRVCKKAFEHKEGEASPHVPEELIQAILAARRDG
jgi:anti-sigma factor RsiW